MRRLISFPSPESTSVSIAQMLDDIGLSELRSEQARPYAVLNMASTADGRASIGGRSGPIGDRADTELLHGLRTEVDALLIGAGTARAEHYARILRDDADRAARLRRGLTPEPLICIASTRLELSPMSVPLLEEQNARVAILTPSRNTLPPCAASVEYVRCERDGALDVSAAVAELRLRHGVRTLLCEGGPTLATDLLAAGLIDELFLSFAPKLAGGGPSLRILAGADLDPPVRLELLALHEHESTLFMRYAVGR